MLLALGLSVLIGVSLGLLGGGGSILTVPILVYALGMEAKTAIATSLLVVGVTSAAAVIPHARAGRVRWRTAVVFGAAGMAGAFASGRVAHFIPGPVLLVAFAAMMLTTAVVMLRGRKSPPEDERVASPPRELPVLKVVLEGVVVGAVTGLVGAGGGFLVVPALLLLGGLPMNIAVGTSLVVIAMKSFAGLAGYLGHIEIDWALAAMVTATAVAGSVVGGLLAARVPQEMLRKSFAWFVVMMAVYMLGRQIPGPMLAAYWRWLLAGSAVAAGAVLLVLVLRARRQRRAKAAQGLRPGASIALPPRPAHPAPPHPAPSTRHADGTANA